VGEQVGTKRGGEAGAPVSDARLAVEFDPRLADVWLQVFASGADLSEAAEFVAWFLRMAYLRGYEDGLCEAQRGSLFSALGLAVPPRRTETRQEQKERRT
jgi:hypothetical protein